MRLMMPPPHPDGDFGVLHIYISRPQFIARQRLEAVHQVLHQAAAVAAAFGNVLNGRVALLRRSLAG